MTITDYAPLKLFSSSTGERPKRTPNGLLSRCFLIGAMLLYLSACASLPATRGSPATDAAIKAALYEQLREWRSVRYRLGGLSKNGIDCSGFVQLTFLDKFGHRLPRTTIRQAALGTAIPRTRLRAGDLVLFKTGSKSRHIGIYIDSDRFIHASTSQGVTVSRLTSPYWRRHYWQARRIGL